MKRTLLHGHCVTELNKLEPQSVHAIVTSPPYYRLRNYATPPQLWCADTNCEHDWIEHVSAKTSGSKEGSTLDHVSEGTQNAQATRDNIVSWTCKHCRAYKGELGWEPTPDLFVRDVVEVTAACWRVLRDDGCMWLNIADSFAASGHGHGGGSRSEEYNHAELTGGYQGRKPPACWKLKKKDMMLIPHRLIIALQEFGWYVRMEQIWNKPNPMRSSATDRTTLAHEYVFHLTKGQWSERTIQFNDLVPETFHFPRNLGASHLPASSTEAACVLLATAIFDLAQSQHDHRLPPFYSEEWKNAFQKPYSPTVSDLPPVKIAASHAARLLNGHTSTKEFLSEIHGMWCHLSDADKLLIRRGATQYPLPPQVLADDDCAVAVNHASKICKVDFTHGQVVEYVPTTCKYYYDWFSISTPVKTDTIARMFRGRSSEHTFLQGRPNESHLAKLFTNEDCARANRLSVWTIPAANFRGAHFATFPPDLARLCILASTSEVGCCAMCGSPYERLIEKGEPDREAQQACGGDADGLYFGEAEKDYAAGGAQNASEVKARILAGMVVKRTTGWKRTCLCDTHEKTPCVVLDPFTGSGTVGEVCAERNLDFVGIDLNVEYQELQKQRTAQTSLKLA